MKSSTIIPVFLSLMLISCGEEKDSPSPYLTGKQTSSENYAKVGDEIHWKLNLQCEPSSIAILEGCACFAPAVDCLNYVVIRGLSIENNFSDFEDALDQQTLPNYFQSNQWEVLFPGLRDAPSLINDLISEDLTFVELDAANQNERVFAIVRSDISSSYTKEDIIVSIPFEFVL